MERDNEEYITVKDCWYGMVDGIACLVAAMMLIWAAVYGFDNQFARLLAVSPGLFVLSIGLVEFATCLEDRLTLFKIS